MLPVLFTIGTLPVRANFVYSTLGFLVCLWVGSHLAQRMEYSRRQVLLFFAGLVLSAFLVGMLNAWLFNRPVHPALPGLAQAGLQRLGFPRRHPGGVALLPSGATPVLAGHAAAHGHYRPAVAIVRGHLPHRLPAQRLLLWYSLYRV